MPTSYEWFKEWQDEPQGKRSSAYETLKSSFVEAAMLVFLKQFPHLEETVGGQSWWLVCLCPFCGAGNEAWGD